MPRFGVDSLAFLLSTITGTLVLAACSNALRIRNHDVGAQSRAAAARGIKLILNTDTLTNPGWALSVGGGGIAVSSLLILLHSMHLQPPTKFAMKVLFLSPVFLALNTLLLTAAAIPVAYYGKNGTTTAEAYIGGARLPDSIVRSQAEASGISLDFWQHGYVKFMVICGIVCIPFAFVTTYFSYKIWRNERHGNPVVQQQQAPGHLSNESGDFDEKNASQVQHIA